MTNTEKQQSGGIVIAVAIMVAYSAVGIAAVLMTGRSEATGCLVAIGLTILTFILMAKGE